MAIESVLEVAPWLGAVALAGAALAVVLGVVAALVALVRPTLRDTTRRVLSYLPAAAFSLFAVSLVAAVERARDGVIEVARGPRALPTADVALRFALNLSAQLEALSIGSILASIAGTAVVLGAVVPWMRAPDVRAGRAPLLAAGCGAVSLFAGVSLAMARYCSVVTLGFGAVANADASSRDELIDLALAEAATGLASARAFVLVVAILAAVAAIVLAVRAARRGVTVRAPGLVGAALVLAVGAAAFASTRAMSYDAEHPLEPAESSWFPGELVAPELARCDGASFAPTLRWVQDDVRLDNRRVTPEQATDDLVTLRRHWGVLHPREPFEGVVAVEADARAPLQEIAPWVRAAHAAGYSELSIESERVSERETRTLGTLERRARCAVSVALDDAGAPIAAFATWQDLARAAGAAEGLRLAP